MNRISKILNNWITSIIAWLAFYGFTITYYLNYRNISIKTTLALWIIVIFCLFLATWRPTHALAHQYHEHNLKFLKRNSVNILASIIFVLIVVIGCISNFYTPAMIMYIIIVPFVLSIFNSLSLVNN